MVLPLPIRRESPPDDTVVVIRAGVMERRSVEDAASRCFEGCEDADPAVARIISVDIEAGIQLQVLGGSVEEHRHLLTTA